MASQPLDIASLVARLRDADLRIDLRQYLAAHELLLALAARDIDLHDNPEALASHLAPIFCGSPEEQERVRREILEWRAVPPVPQPAPPPPERKGERRSRMILIACIAAALGILAVIWWYLRLEPPPPLDPVPPIDPLPPPNWPAPESSFEVSDAKIVDRGDVLVDSPREAIVPWLTVLAGGLGAAVLAFLVMWRVKKLRRDYVLSRMAPDPKTRRVELNPKPPARTRISPGVLRRISAGLRRTRANEVLDLHVTSTVTATARAGGFFVLAYSPRVSTPEYVVLIDRRSESDHYAQLFHGWMAQLREQGVAVESYEFDTDPRVCREYGALRSERLPALLARHHRAAVFLCAESSVCFDAIKNRPHPWLRWFSNLPGRMFLTLAPPYRWAEHEQRLNEAGFVVLPASPPGLAVAASMDRNSLEALGTRAKYAREFPPLIAQDLLRWLGRNRPPDATVARLLRVLHDFLGPGGFKWLCACAVYPQISLPITLHVLDVLLPAGEEAALGRVIDEQLPSLARLPWFRYGYMPDWLRRLLIAHLDPKTNADVRATLAKLVRGLLVDEDDDTVRSRNPGASHLGIRIRPSALEIASAAPPDSPLQDEVFLDFLAGGPPDSLALRLSSLPFKATLRPPGIATRLREHWRALSVQRPLLLRSLVALLFAVPMSVILWASLRQTPRIVDMPDSDFTYRLVSSNLRGSSWQVAIAPNGKFMLLAAPGAGRFVEIWDLVRNESRSRISVSAQPYSMIVSPRSDRSAILDEKGRFYLVDSQGEIEPAPQISAVQGALKQPDDLVRMRFSADSSKLLLYSRDALIVYDSISKGMTSSGRVGKVQDAAFNPDDSNQVIALVDGDLRVFQAGQSVLTLARSLMRVSSDRGDFSLDGRDLAYVQLKPPTRAFLVDLDKTMTGIRREQMILRPGMQPAGWVWSGDGSLVAYEESPANYAIYDLSNAQDVPTKKLGLPEPNTVYTIRFNRTKQRLAGHVSFEIAQRTIDVVPAPDPGQSLPSIDDSSGANDGTSSPPPQSPPVSPSATAETTAINQRVLATLDSEVRNLAEDLIESAAKQGIAIRLTSGLVNGELIHGVPDETSYDLHGVGRAFDVSVRTDNGRWSSTDIKRMTVVGHTGRSLGLFWDGDSDRTLMLHFELPGAGVSPAPAAEPPPTLRLESPNTDQTVRNPITPSENASATSDQPIRIAKTEFEFPRDDAENEDAKRLLSLPRESYAAFVRRPEGPIVGLFSIQWGTAPNGERDRIVFSAEGVANFDQLELGKIPDRYRFARTDRQITVQDAIDRKVTKMRLNPGSFIYTLVVEDFPILSDGYPDFANARFSVNVRHWEDEAFK